MFNQGQKCVYLPNDPHLISHNEKDPISSHVVYRNVTLLLGNLINPNMNNADNYNGNKSHFKWIMLECVVFSRISFFLVFFVLL